MKFSNPLRRFFTPNEQRMLLFVGAVLLLGSALDYLGWAPLQASRVDPDSLYQATKVDTPLQLDIRTATLEELITLPSIGEKRAADIIAYRKAQPFISVNQIMRVKGIGAKTYAKLLPSLLAFGDSTNVEAKADTKPAKAKAKKAAEIPKTELTQIVNLNTANLSELCTLIGIGEVKAKAILAWRSENGNFTSLEDFTKVKGIGAKTLEKNRHRLSVE